MHHNLKIQPQYFCHVADGSKTFEIRENDRGFQPGDTVNLREWSPELVSKKFPDARGVYYEELKGYSGKSLNFKIGYVFPIDDKRVVFSLLPTDGKET